MAVPVSPFIGYRTHPGWNGYDDRDIANDLAILELPEVAPLWATRHDLYRGTDEVGQTGTLVGYGLRGNGAMGALPGTDGMKMTGQNYIEWDDLRPNTLAIDLTDNPGLRSEALGAPGDSGGPLLIGDRIAGVCSYVRSGGWDSVFDVDLTPDRTSTTWGFTCGRHRSPRGSTR